MFTCAATNANIDDISNALVDFDTSKNISSLNCWEKNIRFD